MKLSIRKIDPFHHQNLTKVIIMGEIVRLHELIYMNNERRNLLRYFSLKNYLFVKFNISHER